MIPNTLTIDAHAKLMQEKSGKETVDG